MLAVIKQWIRSRAGRPYVRPWGLAAPIAVLLVCLPLLRPLIHPGDISDNERERLATVESIVERHTQALAGNSFGFEPPSPGDPAVRAGYSRQPPVAAALLAGPYWVMVKLGISFKSNPSLAQYLLTLFGAALPAAAAAGLIYRLGRLFELSRAWRAGLAAAAVFGGGLVSYGTSLNSHAPAAAFLLAACTALYHAGAARRREQARSLSMLAGLLVGFAGVIDLGAMFFLALLPLVILAMHWPIRSRLHAVGWYALGMLAPLLLHVWLTVPITGDIKPPMLHERAFAAPAEDVDDSVSPAARVTRSLIDGLIGAHGILSHFPVVILGLIGLMGVLRGHWPASTKMLAGVTLIGAALIIITYASLNPDWGQPMFGARWFIFFLPLIVFWSGGWLRRPHRPGVWATAGVLLGLSVLMSLLGAAAPFAPVAPGHRGEYTVKAAARWLFKGAPGAGRY